MIASAHTFRRLASAIGLAAVLAALVIPAAFAKGHAPTIGSSPVLDARHQSLTRHSSDALDPAIATAMAAHQSSATSLDRRSPDALDPAIATAIAAHQSSATSLDRRSPGTLDPAIATAMAGHQSSATSLDRRSPDTRDAAAKVSTPQTTPVPTPVSHLTPSDTSKGFEWRNLLIVAAAIVAFFLLVGFGGHALVTRRGRGERTGTVTAA
jgi:hypothetical protein